MSEPEEPIAPSAPAEHPYAHKARLILSWGIVLVLTAFGASALWGLWKHADPKADMWQELIQTQFPVIVGLPLAGCASLFLAVVLRLSAGPIEFEAAGMKFKGASAPIVCWILCFLAMALAMKLLWIVPVTP